MRACSSHAKPGSWLINVARGALIDDRALLRAVTRRPTRRRRPRRLPRRAAAARLAALRRPNIIVTPHTSWSSGRVLDRSIELFCDNLGRFSGGEPLLNLVDPRAGY